MIGATGLKSPDVDKSVTFRIDADLLAVIDGETGRFGTRSDVIREWLLDRAFAVASARMVMSRELLDEIRDMREAGESGDYVASEVMTTLREIFEREARLVAQLKERDAS